jgi:hypothetical protein
MKKNKATKKQSLTPKERLLRVFRETQTKTAGHGVFIIVLIAGLAIGISLFRSRNYINPTRDEAHYNETTAANNVSTIDKKLVNKLQNALNDVDVTVKPNLAPNRTNPFSE